MTTSLPPFLNALLGGLLIGAGAATLLLFNGRVAGISGILAHTLRGGIGRAGWRVAFLVGLLAPAALAGLAGVRLGAGLSLMAVSGLLVGLGAGVGSGCTSGHGVCGLAQSSRRSLVATVVFMATAMLTVYVMRHGISP